MLSANRGKSYDKDLNYVVQISRVILQSIGVWPLARDSSNFANVWRRIINLVCYSFFSFTLIPTGLQIFLVETNPHIRFKLAAPLLQAFTSMVKYTFLLRRDNVIRKGLEETERYWINLTDREEREIMLSKGNVGRRLMILCTTFMYGGAVAYRLVAPLFRGPIVTPENVTIRRLACPGYFPMIDPQSSPTYEILFFLQFVAGTLTYSVASGICGLAAFFVLHICGQLRILIKKMTSLCDGENLQFEIVDKRIAVIVELHYQTKWFLREVESTLEEILFVETIWCTSLICFAGYHTIVEWEDNDTTATVVYIMLFISFTFNLFIFCYIGQQLDDESNDLGLTMATIDWHRLPTKRARDLTLVIAMSNFPMKIVAGKLFHMSLSTFSSMVKTAMAYFNILRSMTM